MAFLILINMSGIADFITCENKELSAEQLLRMLLTIDSNGKPALRSFTEGGGSGPGTEVGPKFDHLTASSDGQTSFTLSMPIRGQIGWVRNGAFMHVNASGTVGGVRVTIPAQPLGTEITFIY